MLEAGSETSKSSDPEEVDGAAVVAPGRGRLPLGGNAGLEGRGLELNYITIISIQNKEYRIKNLPRSRAGSCRIFSWRSSGSCRRSSSTSKPWPYTWLQFDKRTTIKKYTYAIIRMSIYFSSI